jgi:sulfate adenylyltransferase subunit 2
MDRPIVAALTVFTCAVEGIDDPHALGEESLRPIATLLRQDFVVGSDRRELAHYEVVCLTVALAFEHATVGLRRGELVAQGQQALARQRGDARRLDMIRSRRDGRFGGRLGHPATVAPDHDVSVTRAWLTNLRELEAESIHIIREVAAEFERPVLLFSGGKDSAVMLHLAAKAFWPCKLPFPVMHIDTGHNFDEVLEYRDRRVAELGARLIVASVQASIDSGRVTEETGPRASRNRLQTTSLLDAIEEHRFDSVFGGARRDEEKARAKERVFSFRDEFGQWDPKNQRPELWSLYNGRIRRGEHIRVFPLSNWTELDIWQYIDEEAIELPSIYYAHRRQVVERDGMWLAITPFIHLFDRDQVVEKTVRFRTVGDATCTGAVESNADTIAKVIAEVAASRITERGATRADDRISEAGMEDRKREGYF